jgi:hypothetical protein
VLFTDTYILKNMEIAVDIEGLRGPFILQPILDPTKEREWMAEGPIYFGKTNEGIIDSVGNGHNTYMRLKWEKGFVILGPFKTSTLNLSGITVMTVEIDLACNYYIQSRDYTRCFISIGYRGAVTAEAEANRILSLTSRGDHPVVVQFGTSHDIILESMGIAVVVDVVIPDTGLFCHVWEATRG